LSRIGGRGTVTGVCKLSELKGLEKGRNCRLEMIINRPRDVKFIRTDVISKQEVPNKENKKGGKKGENIDQRHASLD